MSEQEKSFDRLAEVPTHYARPPVAPYGTRGNQHTFRCTSAFFSVLEQAFEELWMVCPDGRPEVIVSAGAYVNKPGEHGKGAAFDLDAIFWPGRDFVTLRFSEHPFFYLGIEALMRRHFGVILNHFYNADHRDHIHLDLSARVGFRRVKTVGLFVQLMAKFILGHTIEVDGSWTPATEAALRRLCDELDQSHELERIDNWRSLLMACAERAFALAAPVTTLVAADQSAKQLLKGVYAVIERELAGSPSRKIVETALTGFVEHAAIQKVLNRAKT